MADGEPWLMVSLCLDGELGPIRTAEGKALSQMKLASMAQKEMFAAQGIVDVAELNRRKEEALVTVRTLVTQAGFTDDKTFWSRQRPKLTHAIELVNSRWNTFAMVAFHFNFHVVLGDLGATRIKNVARLHDRPRPSVVRTSAQLTGLGVHLFAVTQTTSAEELATELRTAFQSRYLPWLEAMSDLDAIIRYLTDEHPSMNDFTCGLLLACAGRKEEARAYLSRTSIAREDLQGIVQNYGVELDLG